MGRNITHTESAETTRDDLIMAGISVFGEFGYEAASIRALCKKADANISAVKYHFGGKMELFEACIETVACQLAANGPERFLPESSDTAALLTPSEAEHTVRQIIGSVLASAFDPKQAEQVRLLHGQLTSEGPGLKVFVDTVLSRHLDVFATLFSIAEDRDPDDPATRLRALTTMVQTVSMARSRTLLLLTMDMQNPENHISDLVDAVYPARLMTADDNTKDQ